MNQSQTHIVIVGGGISGLATAYYLQKELDALRITVVEQAPRLGGKIVTHRNGGFILEGGPESFVTRKPEAWELCHELGLQDRLVGTVDSGKNYVLHNGRPAIVPTNPIAFIKSPLLSLRGKLRLLKEPFVAPKTDPADETLGDFIRRRLGDEALDNLVAPAVGSIYLADANHLSVKVSFDRFAELEREYGSVVKGMFALMKEKRAERKAGGQKRHKLPPFATLRGGLIELVEALAEQIEGEILLDTAVTRIQHQADQTQPYQIELDNGQTLSADAVVLAIPTFAMADLLAEHDATIAEQLRDVTYNAVATVNIAFNEEDVGEPFDGFGVVIPESETSQLLAIEGASVKFSHRSPEGRVVLRAFVGGYGRDDLVALPDDELIALVRQELAGIFGIKAEPTMVHIVRWQPANPQCGVGHLAMVDAIENKLQTLLPHLFLTGSGMRGLGIPDCVRQARETAVQVRATLGEASSVMQ